MPGFFRLSSIRGFGMVVLQLLRAVTVITLLTAGAASWVLIIKVDKHKPYFIFECFSLFFNSIFCSLLIASELAFAEFIRIWLRRTWPVLSDHHGLSWLGVGMIIIGCNILGPLNLPDDDDENHMSSPFSSLVLAAGILSFIFGVLNIICAFIWCDRKEGITSRDIRANGSLAQSQRDDYVPDYESGSHASSYRNEKAKSKFMSGFWKKDSDSAQNNGRPNISGPMFSGHPIGRDVEAQHDDRTSPIIPGIKRPDTALHPMNTRRSSRYSEADMSRF